MYNSLFSLVPNLEMPSVRYGGKKVHCQETYVVTFVYIFAHLKLAKFQFFFTAQCLKITFFAYKIQILMEGLANKTQFASHSNPKKSSFVRWCNILSCLVQTNFSTHTEGLIIQRSEYNFFSSKLYIKFSDFPKSITK